MALLQLYAGQISIDGQTTLTAETSTRNPGTIDLLAGQSSVEFDSSVPSGASLTAWPTVTRGTRSSNEVLVDVTPAGVVGWNGHGRRQ